MIARIDRRPSLLVVVVAHIRRPKFAGKLDPSTEPIEVQLAGEADAPAMVLADPPERSL